MDYLEKSFEYDSARSLVWQGDDLIDWVSGGTRFSLQGTVQEAPVYFAGDFDAAVSNRSGSIAVVYKKLGTKGIVLENQRVVREINRSYYHANAYEYPICIWEPKARPTAIIHCPEEYNQLEIEDAISGEIISSVEDRDSPDFFHSRLSVSPSGKYLLSSGWVWHPMDVANIYRLPDSSDLSNLDEPFSTVDTTNEVSVCSWLDDTSVIAANSESYEHEEGEPFTTGALGIWSIKSARWSELTAPIAKLGSLMPLGLDHVISFYEYPKLIRIADGVVLKEWPHIYTGKQTSSIIHHIESLPPIAIDRENLRFAVADENAIHVISFA